MKRTKFLVLSISTSIVVWLSSHLAAVVIALPPPEDIPEEILRTEIIISARSPIDGQPLNPAEYAQLQEQLRVSPPPKLDPKIRDQIFLLRLRKALLQFFPFLGI
ncbi:hypothetical protein H6G41_05945 [Tolypothrix sp. FACHB-123]|uniref:hypothetical protein n=1 Tax=Tolypothrix sp. FACHB-123 TaxID=2692868 RepID=UPI001682FB1B|nr:hypothetical protein [Tolypothrix sp. FACHB-123]MBD2354169.1 hypothetical protein [Tolypothrix sp. FACHB-123]